MSCSKSIFRNSILSTNRSIIDPVGLNSGTKISNELSLIFSNLNIFKEVEYYYTSHIANRTYEYISTSLDKYMKLFTILTTLENATQNTTLNYMLKIIKEGLTGAYNYLAIYGYNIELQYDLTKLNQQLKDYESKINVKTVEMSSTSGQFTINKPVKLCALFNFYIVIYGMPISGVGFDPVKLQFISGILIKKGINPYS